MLRADIGYKSIKSDTVFNFTLLSCIDVVLNT